MSTGTYSPQGVRDARMISPPFAALPAHVHPDDQQAVRRLVRSILGQHKEASAVFRLIHPGGLTRYTRVVAEPVIDANGRLGRVLNRDQVVV
ncbi:PAS domain-containing protein [Streptomyces brasiliensis]|uniref:PAS fold-3 domain-containing protein n=1 Tax=Streptomyces brasiliensis TaxID=1954 RepID=A0A917P7H1_9ACTN|nr:PAS domain-containing protein [Streptomyces brasiliensis]GGJ65432.1 hypothetical protein GCM10010121_090090 [Streptomyces brasiliensis]